jgi:hypothetical protein
LHRFQAENSANSDVYLLRESLYRPAFVPKLYGSKEGRVRAELYTYTLVVVAQSLATWPALAVLFAVQSCEPAAIHQQKEVYLLGVLAVISAKLKFT